MRWDTQGFHPSAYRSIVMQGMKHMLDVAFVILGAVLFVASLIYARACANV
jgi:hypothetical protein